jgi:hypothetical protein
MRTLLETGCSGPWVSPHDRHGLGRGPAQGLTVEAAGHRRAHP